MKKTPTLDREVKLNALPESAAIIVGIISVILLSWVLLPQG